MVNGHRRTYMVMKRRLSIVTYTYLHGYYEVETYT